MAGDGRTPRLSRRETLVVWAAVTVVCALLALVVFGHAVPSAHGESGMTVAVAGLCLVVFTVIVSAAARPFRPLEAPHPARRPAPAVSCPQERLPGQPSRASPVWLQRFLN
ncbi:MAG: hypothetical protein IT431_07255 [Phycisphaerales bacterium]|nr:hypothetical protein [Phycisphaerales bacterium]